MSGPNPDPKDCHQKQFHGNPYRYCGICGWMEDEQPVPGKPPVEPAMHHCIINADVDHLAYKEQYLIGCQCHEGNTKKIWQPGDAPYVCPGSGAVVEDPRTLVPSDQS